MGFFGDLANSYSDAIKSYEDKDTDSVIDGIEKKGNYRKYALENTSSNNGWYRCIKCGKSFRKGDMDIDHIIPQSKGGDNSKYNLQCICKHCNRSKRDDTSETMADLKRRKEEIKKQNKEDKKILKSARDIIRKEKEDGSR